jgi:tetratricopeptide (TPR) repeat protein
LKTNPWIVATAFVVGVSGAQACGPDFPIMLTSCRSTCLLQIRAPGFPYDMAHITTPPPAGRAGGETDLAPSTVDTISLEKEDTEPRAAQTIVAMRTAADGGQAYALGVGLAQAKRLYTAGAVDFNRVHESIDWGVENTAHAPADAPSGEELDKGLTAAIQWFERVTKLPTKEAESRIVWATFMLGRSRELRDRPGDQSEAEHQYRKTIDLVEHRHADPLGLGNFALGELGRIALRKGDYAAAVALYVRQDGSDHALDSLLRVASKIPDNDEVLQHAIQDPLVQRLLIAYGLSNSDSTCSISADADCARKYTAFVPITAIRPLAIVAALGTLNPRKVEWPDQAAALAFAVGNYEVAARLVQVADSPYADWIRGKIALHQGDREGALKAFASAAKRFATPSASDVVLPGGTIDRMQAEHAVLLLTRNDYVEALYQLSATHGYEDDALYVAERVLTIEELKALVDKEEWATKYRDLLARRLARADRIDESLSYYQMPEVKDVAALYADARREAPSGATRLAQARGWYEVSRLEMQSGMELLGTEQCPDYAEYGGGFGGPCAQTPDGVDELTSPDETTRVAASAANPDLRFHYRDVAIKHLFLAADRLPRRSSLLTAVLCNGVAWLQQHDRSYNDQLIKSVYQRYLKDGRSEPWTANFGSRCPQPDFPITAPR